MRDRLKNIKKFETIFGKLNPKMLQIKYITVFTTDKKSYRAKRNTEGILREI